jgi:hypothetical protein
MAKRKAKAKAKRVRITTINLKKKSAAGLQSVLKQVARKKIAIIVLNAPFKLAAATT